MPQFQTRERPTTRVQKGLERLLVAYGRRDEYLKRWVQRKEFAHGVDQARNYRLVIRLSSWL